MWTYRCSAEKIKGGQCTRASTIATWCFQFQGEKFDRATWVETCGWHSYLATRVVSSLAIGHAA